METAYKNLITGITGFAILFWFGGCRQNEHSDSKPAQIVEEIRLQARQEKPYPVTEETRQTYQWYCSQCHGVEGKGNGINARFLTVPPRNHTKANYLETRTDEQLFQAIKLGGLSVGRAPCMPAWRHTLSEEMIHSLVQYIRELCQCEAL